MSKITILDKYPGLENELKASKLTLIYDEKLNKLLSLIEEKTQDEKDLKECVLKVMGVLGVLDEKTQKIKAEIASGEDNFMPHMLKSIARISGLFMKSQSPSWMGGDTAKAQIKEEFSFVEKIIPIIQKHGK